MVQTDRLKKGVGYGEIMFSLSYLPTAERLTVVVVKARSLQWMDEKESADPFVKNIQLRVTVAEHSADGGQARAVGHVIVGTQATGKALSHWNQMMSALRKPIGMWHPLRR
nr:synaptotagmin-12-like [Penaeus vannamei]